MTKTELFIKLAKPDVNGKSRWISKNEFVGEYAELSFGNGASWARKHSTLDKEYIVEFDKTITKGNSIDAIRLNGFNNTQSFNQGIRSDIREFYKNKKCVMLGVSGKSKNTIIELDHKDGRKDDVRVSDIKQQSIEDFQPLCKAANDIKRQICKECRKNNIRWDAKNILGNPYSFYKGDEKYVKNLGCVGCYQYDPVQYRKECVNKIAKEAADFIAKKLYL